MSSIGNSGSPDPVGGVHMHVSVGASSPDISRATSLDSRTTAVALHAIRAEDSPAGVGAHVTPGSGGSAELKLVATRVTPLGSTVTAREVTADARLTAVKGTAGRVNGFVMGTSAAGSTRMHGMSSAQLDAGTKAYQGVVEKLFEHQDELDFPKPDPGIDLAKDNLPISIDLKRLVLCYIHETTGKYIEVPLHKAMEKHPELNKAMEALAVQTRGIVGGTQIASESLLDQCDRNKNKSPSLRKTDSEFQSRLPRTIAEAKLAAVSSRPPTAIQRVDAAEKRLTDFKGALSARIKAKEAEITRVSASPAAGAPPLTPEQEAEKKAQVDKLQKDLSGLEAMQSKVESVDEFALTMALAYSPAAGASLEDIDKAAKELKQATEQMYGGLYEKYKDEVEKPRFSWIFGLGAAPVGFGKIKPGLGRDIVTGLADSLGSLVGVQRLPQTPLDWQAAQSGAQYAGDVGALLYNQLANSEEQRQHYATYCQEQGIKLAQQHATDDIFRALIAAETAPGSFVANLGGGITPEDALAIQTQMNPPPSSGTPPAAGVTVT